MFAFKDGIRGNRHLDASIYECVDINVGRCGIVACGHCFQANTLLCEIFHLPGNIILRRSLYYSVAVALKDRFLFSPVIHFFEDVSCVATSDPVTHFKTVYTVVKWRILATINEGELGALR